MPYQALQVSNPSAYWMDFEAEKSVYYFMEWTEQKTIRKFYEQELDFIERYMKFARQYRVVEPVYAGNKQDLINDYKNYHLSREKEGRLALNMMHFIYEYHNKLVYPSLLYDGSSFKKIISLDPFLTISEIDRIDHLNSPPVRVQMRISESKISLDLYIDNDIFFSEVDNRKVKRDEELGGKRCWVDNRVTARLNVPRLNSFLRDLKTLCMDFGANEFSFENTLDADPDSPQYFTVNGVKIDDSIYFYEGIKDELKKHNFPFNEQV